MLNKTCTQINYNYPTTISKYIKLCSITYKMGNFMSMDLFLQNITFTTYEQAFYIYALRYTKFSHTKQNWWEKVFECKFAIELIYFHNGIFSRKSNSMENIPLRII